MTIDSAGRRYVVYHKATYGGALGVNHEPSRAAEDTFWMLSPWVVSFNLDTQNVEEIRPAWRMLTEGQVTG